MGLSLAPEATPQDGSLTAAQQMIEGLLSDPSDKATPSDRQPEQRAEQEETPAAEQVPTARAEEETPASEPAKDETDEEGEPAEDADAPQPRTLKVKLPGGEEAEVTEEEAAAGYSRTQDYTRKTMELARQRKEFEEKEVAAVRQERQQYHTALTQMQDALEALHGKEPDWATLRLQLPLEQYVSEKERWDETQKSLSAITAEKARLESLKQEESLKGFRDYVEQQNQKLLEIEPEFGDPTKGPALKKSLSETAKQYGFTDEELGQVTDHRLVVLLRDATRYKASQAKAPEIKNKIEKVVQTATPGSTQRPAKQTAADKAIARLHNSGRVEDAGAAIDALLKMG